ncbi:MAG: RHS repeat domain-containing protein, partial [Kiritimatiellia bacterium]|nr:RHS repeat domain-containing protein [Kiritimatiellia bacterium]
PVTVVVDVCDDEIPPGTEFEITASLANGEVVASYSGPLNTMSFVTPSRNDMARMGDVDGKISIEAKATSPWNSQPAVARKDGMYLDESETDKDNCSEPEDPTVPVGPSYNPDDDDDHPDYPIQTQPAPNPIGGSSGCGGASCFNPIIGGSTKTGTFTPSATISLGNADTLIDPPGGQVTLHPTVDRSGVRAITMLAPEGIEEKIHPENGNVQIRSADGVTLIVTTDNGARKLMQFYPQSQVGSPDEHGFYALSGDAPRWISMERVDSITNAAYGFLIKNGSGSLTEETLYTPSDTEWDATQGDGTVDQRNYRTNLGPENIPPRKQTITKIKEPDTGTDVLIYERDREYLPDQLTLLQDDRILRSENGALVERLEFYSNPLETNTFRRVKRKSKGVLHPITRAVTGSWVEYDYDDLRRRAVKRSGVLDSESVEDARAFHYDYSPVDGSDNGSQYPHSPRTIVQTLGGVEVSRTYRAIYLETPLAEPNPIVVDITERCAIPGAEYGAAGNLRTIRRSWSNVDLTHPGVDRLASVQYPDGRTETHTYEFGDYSPTTKVFTPNSAGIWERRIQTHGIVSAEEGLPGRTLQSVRILRRVDETVALQETRVYTGSGYALVGWTAYEYDDVGRLTRTERSNGELQEIIVGCCGPNSTIGATGQIEDYSYDVLRRRVLTTREGAPTGSGAPENPVYISTFYDAADRVTQRVTQASGLSLTNRTVYDSAGRVSQTVDEQGRTTSYGYAADGLSQTVTNANGSVIETARYRDGRSKYTKLNGEYREVYAYGVEEDGSQWTMVFSGPDGTNSPVW